MLREKIGLLSNCCALQAAVEGDGENDGGNGEPTSDLRDAGEFDI